MKCSYDFLISDLLLRVQSPKQLQIPDNFQPFLTEPAQDRIPDIFLDILLEPAPASVFQTERKFHWKDGEYIVMQEPAGRGTPCRLFLPPSFAETFCRQGRWLNYLAIERLLLPYDRLILHASAVIYQGKAYLFSAPSGGGKSTHAALWQEHFDARILNGDKVVVHAGAEGVVAYGSPVAGSSGIYRKEGAPVAALFMLQKSARNKLTLLPTRTAILSLYSEAIKSGNDPDFNGKLLDLIVMMKKQTPVYSLECLPEKSAVECVLQKMEGMTP